MKVEIMNEDLGQLHKIYCKTVLVMLNRLFAMHAL